MDKLLADLDAALRTNHPSLHAALQPGINVSSGPSELKAWFRWRNGQSRDAVEFLHGTYQFVGYSDGRAELQHMRNAVWQSPLNAALLAMVAPGSFYSIPMLTMHSGEGYYFNLFRRSVDYRLKGERNIRLNSFAIFLDVMIELALRPVMAPGEAAKYEQELLGRQSVDRER